MSSEPNGATQVENAVAGKGELIERQGSVGVPESQINSTATQDTIPTLPQGDAKPSQKMSSDVPGNGAASEDDGMPEWEGDPYEYLLKPMLETDTDQCNAWKDEVQNTLIFAGLFSAVVTAFIIESYQRLRPDSNDIMVGLLAHIANRLDNAPNNTESASSIIANTSFSPSRTDININIFWFISLVLSLTTALIGIVTLQWLREHQRYDMTRTPQERFAILNARLHSLKQWYVPQILAGLPLLLQGALILFFAGMIEFLFALRLEVAIPVTVAVCLPLIFLIATTLLPLLQACILQDAFRLSINNDVPSPCPYKSPQSLVVHRIGLCSEIAFWLISSTIAGVYICVVQIACFIYKLEGRSPPIFHSSRRLVKSRLCDDLPRFIGTMAGPDFGLPENWMSTDETWLQIRTIYALSLETVHRDDADLVVPRKGIYSEYGLPKVLYDCTSGLDEVLWQTQPDAKLFNACYSCMTTLCSEAMDKFQYLDNLSDIPGVLFPDLWFAFGQFVYNDLNARRPISIGFIDDVLKHESSDKPITPNETLSKAFILSWVDSVSLIWSYEEITRPHRVKLFTQLAIKRLELGPQRLFSMRAAETWLPSLSYERNVGIEEFPPSAVTDLFHTFLKDCSEMQLNSPLDIRPSPARETYGGILVSMEFHVRSQPDDRAVENLAHLTQLCGGYSPQDLIRDRPFLLIAACFYLDAMMRHQDVEEQCAPLKSIIASACGTTEGCNDSMGWTGLDDAVNAIYKHHTPSPNYAPSQQLRSERNGSTQFTNQTGDDNHV